MLTSNEYMHVEQLYDHGIFSHHKQGREVTMAVILEMLMCSSRKMASLTTSLDRLYLD
jgi:hypothetical protein